jgi:hypothetical protein
VPVLVLSIAKYLDKLFQNGNLAAVASLGELRRVVVVAVNVAVVLVVTVLRTKYRITERARKMVNVVLAVQSSDV